MDTTHSFADGQQYTGETFRKRALPDGELSGIDWTDCTFDGCVFTGNHFARCAFTGCRFTGCDLSLMQPRHTTFQDTYFTDCKLVGVDWTLTRGRAEVKFPLGVGFTRCILDYAAFFGLSLAGVTFADCTARETDFREANLTGAKLCGMDCTGALFHHTNLTRADLTDAHDYTIDPTANTITRAIFSLPDALALLAGFDIVIT